MKELAHIIIMAAVELWNAIMDHAFSIIKLDITSTDMWNIIEYLAGTNGKITGVATIILTIFILIGFCSNSTDIKRDFSLDSIFKLLIKIIISEFVVINNLKIFIWIYSIGIGIAGFVKMDEMGALFSAEQFKDIVEADGIWVSMFIFILSILFLIVIVGSGLMLLYEVYLRIVKTCLIIPIGALTWSTLGSGSDSISNTALSYFKFAVATILEMFMMIFAMKITNVFFVGGLDIFDSILEKGDIFVVIVHMTCAVFQAIVTVSMVRESRNLIHRLI